MRSLRASRRTEHGENGAAEPQPARVRSDRRGQVPARVRVPRESLLRRHLGLRGPRLGGPAGRRQLHRPLGAPRRQHLQLVRGLAVPPPALRRRLADPEHVRAQGADPRRHGHPLRGPRGRPVALLLLLEPPLLLAELPRRRRPVHGQELRRLPEDQVPEQRRRGPRRRHERRHAQQVK